MKTILILLTTLTCNAYEALSITDENRKNLKTLEERLYDLATCKESHDYIHVVNFIFKNLAYKLDYTLLKIESKATARAIQQQQNAATQYTNESSKLVAEISLTYPLLDKKEDLERQKKIIDTKQSIIKDCRKYFDLKAELEALHVELDLLMNLEVRAKSRKLSGVDSFDNWLKIIKDIKSINEKITLKEIEQLEAKEILLSLVPLHVTATLEQML